MPTVHLSKWQTEVWESPTRFKVMNIGRRSGKTVLSVLKMIEVAGQKKCTVWYVAPTYKQAKLIAWSILKEYMPPLAKAQWNESELKCTIANGSEIHLKGADNPDSLRGTHIDFIVFDEVAFFTDWRQCWEALRPVLVDSKADSWFVSTPNGYNHFYDLYKKELEDSDYKSFHFTSYDNPYLDVKELDKVKAEMSEESFAQEFLAEFMKRSGAIYKLFSRDIHIVPRREVDRGATIFGSIDFGYAEGHAAAVLWHEVNGEQVYTFDGFKEERLDIDEVDARMHTQTNGLVVAGIIPDTARPDLIEALRRKGWPILNTVKDVELGISKVESYMKVNPFTGLPRWTMSNHLSFLAEEIEQYVWQEVRGSDGLFKQVPKKENDDAVDALRYFIASYENLDRDPIYVPSFQGLGGSEISSQFI